MLDAAAYDDLRAEQRRRREAGERKVLGLGLSSYVEITAGPEAGTEFARVNVKPDGSVIVYTGTSPHGQGHGTSFAMLAADELGIPMERITVVHGDTDLVARGGGTGGSRSLQLGGAAVHQGAIETVDKARDLAADLFEAAPGDVVLDKGRGGFHVAGSPDEVRSWAEVAASADSEQGLIVDTDFTAQGATFPFGAHVAVVEVDAETGKTTLRRYVAVDDVGNVINPMIVDGQIMGGIAQGIAEAMYEEAVYDDNGILLTSSMMNYLVPSALEIPTATLDRTVTPSSTNSMGVKGIGEAGTIAAPPAVLNAVADALAPLGVTGLQMPVSPQRVWRAIQDASGEKGGQA